MSHGTNKQVALGVVAILWGGMVHGQVPGAPIAATIGAVEPAATTPSDVAVAPDLHAAAVQEGFADNASRDALERLANGLQLKRAQIEDLKADKEMVDIRTSIGITNTQGDLPELVGVFVMPKRQWAEFLVGHAVLSASPGDWVTPAWRVKRLLANGVVLIGEEGKDKTLLFGKRSAPGDLPRAANAPQLQLGDRAYSQQP